MASNELIVIGAGPAGIRAAADAAALGLRVLLLDEQPAPGGQIYRNVANNVRPAAGEVDVLGEDYWRGREVIDALAASGVEHVRGATVWTVEKDPLAVGYVVGEESFLREAGRVIVATGAYERPVPVRGWTLPGVMTAGAVQVLMKSQGAVPEGRIVLAGSGPLMMLVACQLHAAGANIVGFVETTPGSNWRAAIEHLPRALAAPAMMLKGLGLRRTIRASGIRAHSGANGLACTGSDRVDGVEFDCGGTHHRIDADLVLLHEGVVPNVQITRMLGLEHDWHEPQRYWRPKLGQWGETSDGRISVVGDGGGIIGAAAAETSGRIAALHVGAALGAITADERDRRAGALFARKRAETRIRPFLDHLYRPAPEVVSPTDPQVVVCRCEEVDVGEIRSCVADGSVGPNQLKAYSRCGMGPCQGRMCGLTVAEVIARERGVAVDEVGYYRVRSPIKPITLSALAAMRTDEQAASR